MREEIEKEFVAEREKNFRKKMILKLKDELRRGMQLDLQEEGRLLLVKQKKDMAIEIEKEIRKKVEKEVAAAHRLEMERLRDENRRLREDCEKNHGV